MKTVADINVLIPILVGWHAHHATAWAWWDHTAPGAVGLCWPVKLGVLRLLTNPRAMNARPVSPVEALDAWTALARDPRSVWLDEIPSSHEILLRRFVSDRAPTPNLWTDAWLAALAESLGFRLTSFDADFRSFGLTDFELLRG